MAVADSLMARIPALEAAIAASGESTAASQALLDLMNDKYAALHTNISHARAGSPQFTGMLFVY